MRIDVKRFYLPGFVVTSTCPVCGEEVESDLGDQYLSYPSTGPQELGMSHTVGEDADDDDFDEHDWTVRVDLQVTLTAVSGCNVLPPDEDCR